MQLIKKISKALCVSLVLTGAFVSAGYANAGSAQAIISGSDEDRNIIGFEMAESTPAQNVITGCEGVFVSAVIPGHPASTAGLLVGDIITKINNNPVKDKSEALQMMVDLDPGTKYPFDVCRLVNGQVQKLAISILVEKVKAREIAQIS